MKSFLGGRAERVGFIRPGEEKAPGRLYYGLPIPEGTYKKAGEGLFIRAHSERIRGTGFKLKDSRFRLHIRKTLFTMRVVRHWDRLFREFVDAPSLGVFKPRLDRALSNLVWWKVSRPMAGGLEPNDA